MPAQEQSNFKRLVLLTLAFSLLTTTTLLMNVKLFPLIDSGFPLAREVCVFAYAVVLVVMGVLCARTRMDQIARVFDVLAFSLPVLGVFSMLLGYALSNTTVLAAGAVIGCMGKAMVLMYVGVAMVAMPHFDIVAAVAIGFLVQRIASLGFGLLSDFFVIFFYALMPLLALGLSYGASKDVFAEIRIAHSAAELSATNPFSFVPLKSFFMLSLFVYQVVFGFSMRFGEGTGGLVNESWIVAPLALLVIFAALKLKRPNADDLNDFAVIVVISAFLVILVGDSSAFGYANSLLAAGSTIFNIVAWVALLGLTSNNHFAAPAVIGFGRGICSLGSITGAQIGIATNNFVSTNPNMVNVVAASMVLILVVFTFLFMRHFSFYGTAAGLVPMVVPEEEPEEPMCIGVQEGMRSRKLAAYDEGASEAAMEADHGGDDGVDEELEAAQDLRRGFDERCYGLAEQYGLTQREKEVFLLLARGRNRDYIQEALVISKNTVKVHVKHIYQKMDVHSHQELIDMVVSTL